MGGNVEDAAATVAPPDGFPWVRLQRRLLLSGGRPGKGHWPFAIDRPEDLEAFTGLLEIGLGALPLGLFLKGVPADGVQDAKGNGGSRGARLLHVWQPRRPG